MKALTYLVILLSLVIVSCESSTEAKDCAGVAGGAAVLDECDVCNGDGIADGACDCAGNALDCAGFCDGTAVEDCAGVCGGDATTADCADGLVNEGNEAFFNLIMRG